MYKSHSSVTIAIPTKNRPLDLVKVLGSIFEQTNIPDHIVIVDQSDSTISRELSFLIFKKFNFTNYQYIYDNSISGLVEAKKVSVKNAKGDLIFFLEDDVILDANYVEEIKLGFSRNQEMIGCSGVIKNHPDKGRIHTCIFNLFHVGIFKDIRFRVYADTKALQGAQPLIPSNKLSGGVSAWRREVFEHVQFDLLNDFHMLEDIDFSTRVAMRFGSHLYINPNAKLDHNFAPSGRASIFQQRRRKVRECIVYYKKRSDLSYAFLALSILIFGLFLNALIESMSLKSTDPLKGVWIGVKDGISYQLASFTEDSL